MNRTLKIVPVIGKAFLSAFFFLSLFSCNNANNTAVATGSGYTNIAYSQTKFVPPDGTYLLIGGQDKDRIAEIPAAWGISPGGYASYFAVSDSNGIWSDYTVCANNVQNSAWIAANHTNAVLQIAIWMVGPGVYGTDYPANTTNSVYTNYLRSFCDFAKSVHAPIYLRIGYEFDGTHNELDPAAYVNAYRFIVDYIRARGVSNVAFVWHSYAAVPYNGYPVANWYPGDSYVDWFGLSVFRDHVLNGNYSSYLDTFVNMAKAHLKPVMISESCPNGGINDSGSDTWNRWFVPYLNYIHSRNIKAFSYINCNWEHHRPIRFFRMGQYPHSGFPEHAYALDKRDEKIRIS